MTNRTYAEEEDASSRLEDHEQRKSMNIRRRKKTRRIAHKKEYRYTKTKVKREIVFNF